MISAFTDMKSSRCNPWDQRELDAIEGYRFISFVMLQIVSTTMYMSQTVQTNPWKQFDFV